VQGRTHGLPIGGAVPVRSSLRPPLTPPGERVAVPGPLAAITMKLLAKNAEDRYQTAVSGEMRATCISSLPRMTLLAED
jgi:hypothetical protein